MVEMMTIDRDDDHEDHDQNDDHEVDVVVCGGRFGLSTAKMSENLNQQSLFIGSFLRRRLGLSNIQGRGVLVVW